jgi:hypothetical protein
MYGRRISLEYISAYTLLGPFARPQGDTLNFLRSPLSEWTRWGVSTVTQINFGLIFKKLQTPKIACVRGFTISFIISVQSCETFEGIQYWAFSELHILHFLDFLMRTLLQKDYIDVDENLRRLLNNCQNA